MGGRPLIAVVTEVVRELVAIRSELRPGWSRPSWRGW